MKIINIKKSSKGKYKVIFDNMKEFILYEDVVVNNRLLIDKVIDNKELNKIKKENDYYIIYNSALKHINIRLRSENEIINYLNNKAYDQKLIERVVNQLKKEGYINDYKFIKAYINDKVNFTNFGPFKIKQEIKNYNVSEEIVEDMISKIDNNIWQQKLEKGIKKILSLNKKYTGNVLKQRIYQYFLNLGYNNEMINNYINNIDYDNNNYLEKEFNKLWNKYNNKYDNAKLKYIIQQKLLQKGYQKIDIDNLIKKSE